MSKNDRNDFYQNLIRELNLDDIKDILSYLEEVRLNPGDIFIHIGNKEKTVGYIQNGLIKASVIDDEGEEKVCLLRWEGQFVGTFNRPARFMFKAVEPTTILRIKIESIHEIISQNPRLDKIFKDVLLYYLSESLEHLETFVLLSPKQRYLQFIETNPEIVNRVPDKYIASVLGITPESLSRIRKRISNE